MSACILIFQIIYDAFRNKEEVLPFNWLNADSFAAVWMIILEIKSQLWRSTEQRGHCCLVPAPRTAFYCSWLWPVQSAENSPLPSAFMLHSVLSCPLCVFACWIPSLGLHPQPRSCGYARRRGRSWLLQAGGADTAVGSTAEQQHRGAHSAAWVGKCLLGTEPLLGKFFQLDYFFFIII